MCLVGGIYICSYSVPLYNRYGIVLLPRVHVVKDVLVVSFCSMYTYCIVWVQSNVTLVVCWGWPLYQYVIYRVLCVSICTWKSQIAKGVWTSFVGNSNTLCLRTSYVTLSGFPLMWNNYFLKSVASSVKWPHSHTTVISYYLCVIGYPHSHQMISFTFLHPTCLLPGSLFVPNFFHLPAREGSGHEDFSSVLDEPHNRTHTPHFQLSHVDHGSSSSPVG